ncbi:uncharacterized protein LOC129969228 [Argiope bruennichi]|uniref:uncharacterized protein LOC129969228 n=1 Tax=Argiope bruennichi TaxID=94029 RepID=UPI002494CBF0|nr:uncharacterized protein LOC129969228 [Argiope bruennichi]
MNPTEELTRVHFHFNLPVPINKKENASEYLRQLALEVINKIPKCDIKLYTDGSKIDNSAGSGIYIVTPQSSFSLCQRNPDFCSVFRSELLAIDEGLKKILHENNYKNLWILTDSRSSIEHLNNWTYVGDKASLSILQKLKLISLQHDIHFQWIPSHVDLLGNEIADRLAKKGSSLATSSSAELTHLELFSQAKFLNKKNWMVPPTHDWYRANKLGQSLNLPCDRKTNTCLSRLASGHLKCLFFSQGEKFYPLSPKCCQHQASAEHIVDCLGFHWGEIYSSPFLVFDFLLVNGFLDLV